MLHERPVLRGRASARNSASNVQSELLPVSWTPEGAHEIGDQRYEKRFQRRIYARGGTACDGSWSGTDQYQRRAHCLPPSENCKEPVRRSGGYSDAPHLREAIEASPVMFTYLETRQGKAKSQKGLGTLCANGATRRACPFVRLMCCARRSVAGLLRRAVHRSR